MAFTLIANIPLTVLPPIAPTNGTALNPAFLPVDPINGNFLMASGRDLLTFYCSPVALAPQWNSTTTYTQGQVINVGSLPFIAVTNINPNLNQPPVISPPSSSAFWAIYVSSTLTIFSSPDACTGRKSDIVNYVVPNGGHTQVEIMGSSFFTQTNGQIQFLANSNLITVLIQSL